MVRFVEINWFYCGSRYIISVSFSWRFSRDLKFGSFSRSYSNPWGKFTISE